MTLYWKSFFFSILKKRVPWLNTESSPPSFQHLIYFCFGPVEFLCVVAKSATALSRISQVRVCSFLRVVIFHVSQGV